MGIAPVFLPVREMGGLLRRRQASPVELAELFIDRLETLGPRYNSVVTVTRDRALAEARAAEKEIASGCYRGPLHGVPYGVKDLLATAGGIPTTWGAAPLRDQTFDYDATVVRRLTDAGAVLVAKLAMIELAGGMGYRQPDASFTGPCKTPWDLDHWAGGSSSGSGSAVAAGLVPFSIGSETRGSILSPANNCGIAGLRPTYGRVSRYGAMALSWTLDKLGPMCLTADDCGLVLDAIAGGDPNDPSATDRSYSYQPSAGAPQRFRLGVLEDATAGANPSVRANFDAALETLAQIADIERVRLPDLPYGAVAETIISAEASSSLEEIVDSGQVRELTAPEDRYGHVARRAVSARDYLKAQRLRGVMCRVADDLLSSVDAIAGPTMGWIAAPLGTEFRGSDPPSYKDLLGALGNVAGLPAISVPSGFSDQGLPTGIQFMGRAYDDNTVIAVATAYQSLTDWHTMHPPDLVNLLPESTDTAVRDQP